MRFSYTVWSYEIVSLRFGDYASFMYVLKITSQFGLFIACLCVCVKERDKVLIFDSWFPKDKQVPVRNVCFSGSCYRELMLQGNKV